MDIIKKRFSFSLENKESPIIHNKRSRKNKHLALKQSYIWSLCKFLKTDFSTDEFGSVQKPSFDIGNGLNIDSVLTKINSTNSFEFDYSPNDGDNLKIFEKRKNELTPYLSFIYKNNKWKSDYYGFYDYTELIVRGVIIFHH